MHINYLELLAVQTFLKNHRGLAITLPANGQYHSSFINQCPGRDDILHSHILGQVSLALVSEEGHLCGSTTPSRCNE